MARNKQINLANTSLPHLHSLPIVTPQTANVMAPSAQLTLLTSQWSPPIWGSPLGAWQEAEFVTQGFNPTSSSVQSPKKGFDW